MKKPSKKPEQLQMLMTPREIRSKYQVLDADREETYDHDGPTGMKETGDQMMARKRSEAYDVDYHGHDQSMGEAIESGHPIGGSPIWLSTNQIGSEGKQQVIGGHHRLAVHEHLHPDQFLPVLHDKNIITAQRDYSPTFRRFRNDPPEGTPYKYQ